MLDSFHYVNTTRQILGEPLREIKAVPKFIGIPRPEPKDGDRDMASMQVWKPLFMDT